MRILSAVIGLLLLLGVYWHQATSDFVLYADQQDVFEQRIELSAQSKKVIQTGSAFRRLCLSPEQWRRYGVTFDGSADEPLCRIFPDSGLEVAYSENGVLSYPTHFRVGNPVEIHFRFLFKVPELPMGEPLHLDGQMKPTIAESSDTDGVTSSVTAQNQSRSVSIIGDGFEISPAGDLPIVAKVDENVELRWVVTPESTGQRTLIVDASPAFVSAEMPPSQDSNNLSQGPVSLSVGVYRTSGLSSQLIKYVRAAVIIVGIVLVIPILILVLRKLYGFFTWVINVWVAAIPGVMRLSRWLMRENRYLKVSLIAVVVASGLYLISGRSAFYVEGTGIGRYRELIHVKEDRVYLGRYLLEGIDGKTVTHLWRGFLKDKNHVYGINISEKSGHRYCEGVKEFSGLHVFGEVLNPDSFELIGSPSHRYLYARDDTNVYALKSHSRLQILDGIDVSFEPITGPDERVTNYHKDKLGRVYYHANQIENADFDTFTVVAGLIALDKNAIFVRGEKFVDRNGELKLLNSHTSGGLIAKDDTRVFDLHRRKIFSGIDAASFEYINDVYAKDKHAVYCCRARPSVVARADPDSIESFSRKSRYAKDKHYVYYRNDVVAGADPDSFHLLEKPGRPDARDRYQSYYQGRVYRAGN